MTPCQLVTTLCLVCLCHTGAFDSFTELSHPWCPPSVEQLFWAVLDCTDRTPGNLISILFTFKSSRQCLGAPSRCNEGERDLCQLASVCSQALIRLHGQRRNHCVHLGNGVWTCFCTCSRNERAGRLCRRPVSYAVYEYAIPAPHTLNASPKFPVLETWSPVQQC
jgi:hypothetical protein